MKNKSNEVLVRRVGKVGRLMTWWTWERCELQETAEVVGVALESALKEYLAVNERSLIKTSMFSFSMLKNEMNKNALYTFPFISLTLLLLVTFTILSWSVYFFSNGILETIDETALIKVIKHSTKASFKVIHSIYRALHEMKTEQSLL